MKFAASIVITNAKTTDPSIETHAVVFACDKKCAGNTKTYRDKINQQPNKPAHKPLQISNSLFQIGYLASGTDFQIVSEHG